MQLIEVLVIKHASKTSAYAFVSCFALLNRENTIHISPDLLKVMEQSMIAIEQKSAYLLDQLNQPAATSDEYSRSNKELRKLGSSLELIKEVRAKRKEIDSLKSLLSDCSEDRDLCDMASKELDDALEQEKEFLCSLLKSLLPRDDADERDCILEELEGRKHLSLQWIYSRCMRNIPRKKEASGTVSGCGVYGKLKFESGVHRVQRVPLTEKSGRIHTSAVSVAILPQADEVDIQLRNEDLRVDTYRSGGCGGQSVNTTNSAVRITHIPTGIAVAIQDERSQHMNKAKALKVLRARLYEIERSKLQMNRSKLRSEQIGSGDRSERIRTYNFPQGRVTDHRAGITHHAIEDVLEGESLDVFIDALLLKEEMDAISTFSA